MPSLERLRRMSVAEIACRGRQEAAKWIERVTTRSSTPAGAVIGRPSAGAGDEIAGAMQQFLIAKAPALVDSGVVNEIAARWPSHCASVIASAESICQGHFALLGYDDLFFGEPVDWWLDPVSDRRSPDAHWSRINPLDSHVVGDSKVVWELSRHQFLVTLGQAYRLTADDRFARHAVALLRNWLAKNPHGQGINWTSSLELAYRLISWCWALALFQRSPALDQAVLETLGASIREHARHIERYLSYYFSPNTHLTGEALGLVYAGTLFDTFREAARWREVGGRILSAECERQIFDDGVYFEQATGYHRYTIEIYCHFLKLAPFGVPADYRAIQVRLTRMLDYLMHVCRPDGAMPAIGDGDGGWVMPFAPRAPGDCRGVFGYGAVLLNRGDLAWIAHDDVADAAWMFGRSALDRLDRLASEPPERQASRLFDCGGYAVMRSDWRQTHRALLVDCGPLGCPISGAHGHADLLSIHCSAFGEDWIVDAGTYRYTPEPAWRNYFRSTQAHSTVVVDGSSQAQPSGPFAWRHRPSARLRTWRSQEEFDLLDADHDAYAQLPDPVVHRRRVLFVKPEYWVVVDDLAGVEPHDIELRFQVTAVPRFGTPTAAWVGRQERGLWIVPFAAVPLHATVASGSTDPIDGWRSSAYGLKEPAPVLIYSASGRLPLRIVTLLLPVANLKSLEPPRIEAAWAATGELTGLSIPRMGHTVTFDDKSFTVENTQCAES